MVNAIQGSLFDVQTVLDYGQSIVCAGQEFAKSLINNQPLANRAIQSQMNRYFNGTAASGAWQWKDAYEAVEVALILYLRQKGLPQNPLEELQQLELLCPTHTRRSEEQLKLQQFSTPLPLAYLVALAGQIQSDDLVLEPSAGIEFSGAIAFDECHAMGNAMAQEGKLGTIKASMQGIIGLRLQNALPLARVIYVSATGATKVSNLSYANRLGLWQTGDFPFTSREDFVESILCLETFVALCLTAILINKIDNSICIITL